MDTRNIFSDKHVNDDSKSADLSWQTETGHYAFNLISLAKGYSFASLKLIEDLLISNKNSEADYAIFPIIFDMNHSIELYLKAMIIIVDTLGNTDGENDNYHHNVIELYKALKKRIIQFEKCGNRRKFIERTSNLEKYLDELDILITNKRNMDFPRYPFSKENEEQFYIASKDYNLPTKSIIDLENLRKRFSDICCSLDFFAMHYLKVFEDIVITAK